MPVWERMTCFFYGRAQKTCQWCLPFIQQVDLAKSESRFRCWLSFVATMPQGASTALISTTLAADEPIKFVFKWTKRWLRWRQARGKTNTDCIRLLGVILGRISPTPYDYCTSRAAHVLKECYLNAFSKYYSYTRGSKLLNAKGVCSGNICRLFFFNYLK